MAKNPPVIALDLDFTLARFRGGYPGIFDIVASFGIERIHAEIELRRTIESPRGLNLKEYAQNLFVHDTETAQKLAARLEAYFDEEFDWYPGVRDILENWKKSGITLVVVTAGALEFQSAKIRRLGFEFDATHITNITQKNGKALIISRLLQEYPGRTLLYVDDKSSELINIAEDPYVDLKRVKLFQISHGDRPTNDQISKKGICQKVYSLKEMYG